MKGTRAAGRRNRLAAVTGTVKVLAVCVLFLTAQFGPIAQASARSPADAASPTDTAVAQAVDDSRSYILDSPNRTGDHWASNISMGGLRPWDLRYTIEYALVLERLGIDSESKRRAVEYVLQRRQPDGGWNDTIANYAGLLLLSELDGEYQAERRAIRSELDRANASLVDVEAETPRDEIFLYRTRLFYTLMDERRSAGELFPNETLKELPGLLLLTPAFEGEFSPTDHAVNHNALDTMISLNVLSLEVRSNVSTDEEDAKEALTEVLLKRRQTSGAWATAFDTMYAVLALHEAGYEVDDDPIRIATRWLEENRQAPSGRFVAFRTPVWDTAWTVQALTSSGLSPDNETVKDAAQWLVDARTTTNVYRTRRNLTLDRPPLPFRSHYGHGWSYKPELQSNWGETAVVTRTLAPYDEMVVADSVTFLFDVQNEDGTWSTWSTDFDPLNESEQSDLREELDRGLYRTLFGDEPVPGTNGHVLMSLGAHGYTVENNASVRAAVDYLLGARDRTEMWPAKWGVRYTYGTSRVIQGLVGVGVDPNRPEIQEAAAALVERQNPDGGWGEGILEGGTFPGWDDAQYLSAPSTPEQTAWALQALLAAGYSPDHPAVRAGVQYLLDTQRPDGSWAASPVMYQGAPPTYVDEAWTQAAALLALSAYADAAGVDTSPDRPGPADESLPVPPWLVANLLVLAVAVAIVVRLREQP